MSIRTFALVALAAIGIPASWAYGQQAPAGVVCNVKVLSDKVQDVSSLEAWKSAFVKEGASDQDKAIAIWDSVVRFVHEDSPPREQLNWEGEVNDPIKTMNVYGYALCNNTAAELIGLARYAGFKAQGWTIQGHCVADVWYGDAWHYLDASFIEYFPKADGTLAGVEEVFASVKDWYDKNPGYKGNQAKLREFLKDSGWKNGPEVMSRCPLYDAKGQLPAKTHGWYSTMREFDGTVKTQGYESGYSNGYRVNIQLRPGEKLTRNWSNKGLEVNMLPGSGGKAPGCLARKVGQDDLCYTPKWGDLAPGRVGNGTLVYEPPSESLRKTAYKYENLVCMATDAGHYLYPADRGKSGELVIRMPSSYVYLSGKLEMDVATGAGGSLVVSLSDNNGLDWTELAKIDKAARQSIDLKEKVGRRYDYRLKFVLDGNVRMGNLKIAHDIQHSQRALPALDKGDNKITFSAGPQEGTVTIEGSTDPAQKGKQLTVSDFHPTMENVTNDKPGLMLSAGKGSITLPVQTPGDMTALRVGTMYRARDAKDIWEVEASFDDGKTFKSLVKMPGETRINSDYTVFKDIPAGTKSALVRWSGSQKNTLMIFNLRLDADYKAPGAGFAPVKVTYVWDEDGKEKRDEHVAKTAQDSWTIKCDAKPVMKSIIMELAK